MKVTEFTKYNLEARRLARNHEKVVEKKAMKIFTEADVRAAAKALARNYACETRECNECKDKNCNCRQEAIIVLKAVEDRRKFYSDETMRELSRKK